MPNQIHIGDKVRSYDFTHHDRQLTGPRACYVEGEVLAIGSTIDGHNFDCARYKIRATKRVFRGEELTPERPFFYPPVNGTPILGSDRKTNSVEHI